MFYRGIVVAMISNEKITGRPPLTKKGCIKVWYNPFSFGYLMKTYHLSYSQALYLFLILLLVNWMATLFL